jgi:ribosomal protein S27AE
MRLSHSQNADMVTEDTQYCPACGIVVPIVQPVIGRAIGALGPALGVQLLGKRGAKSLGGTLLVAGIGLFLGYLADQAMDAVCGQCGGTISTRLA